MDTATSNLNLKTIVTDSYLQSVLEACDHTREQCMRLIEQVEAHPLTEGKELPLDSQLALSQEQKVLHSYLSQLRGFNRDSVLKVRNTKQQTAEARQEIDRLHLHLQNLYYEEMHLRGEIAACESYEYAPNPKVLLKVNMLIPPIATDTNLCL